MSEYILEMKNIIKEFPGVRALDGVTFNVKSGEIHCLVGENGAGKSTLMKVLSGFYPYGDYRGDIIFNGTVQKFSNIKDSEKAGLAIIYQELALVPQMSIFENLFLGNEIRKNNIINWNEAIKQAKILLEKVGLKENPETKIADIGIGKRQLVEIAKALAKKVKLLILDEPTAALNEDDSANLLKILKNLKAEGVSCIMISHKLNEVLDIADEVTVLRDGKSIISIDKKDRTISKDEIVRHMVGRELNQFFPERNVEIGNIFFEVKDWNVYHHENISQQVLKDICFHVKTGEIVGIAGLMGSGRTELAMSLFGKSYGNNICGEIYLDKNIIRPKNPREAIDLGFCYLTEDRKEKGLILIDDIKRNISLPNLLQLIKGFFTLNDNEEIKQAEKYRKSMKIKTPSIEQKVGNLSGGNQQKVALSKWMLADPKILIVDEPTRGIDVGAKYEIYTIMNELVAQGRGIVMISSELPEILGMSDRIYVMHEGRLVKELQKNEATQEIIMTYATGQGGN
ncbi:MAG: ATP-binding cassette domain-containing protein [Fusobacteriaceae bacterium]